MMNERDVNLEDSQIVKPGAKKKLTLHNKLTSDMHITIHTQFPWVIDWGEKVPA